MRFRFCVLFVLLSACATREVQRNTARLTAVNVAGVQKQLNDYATARTAADVLRQRTMNRLEASALSTEATNDFDVRAWTIATPEKGTLYNDILDATAALSDRAVKNDASLAANAALLKSTKSAIDTRSDALGNTSKLLSKLALEKGRDDFTFYLGFFKEVKSTIDDAKNKAKSDAAGTAAQMAEATTTGGSK